MTIGKKEKIRAKRRAAGLVITPPKPRPVEENHPARVMLRDAIESARARSEGLSLAGDSQQDLIETDSLGEGPSVAPVATIYPVEPLRIFQDLRDVTSKEGHPQAQDSSELSSKTKQSDLFTETTGLPFPIGTEDLSHLERTKLKVTPTIEQPPEAEATLDAGLSFEDFENSFRKRLSKGQLRVCKVIFERTYAVGSTTCLIRVNDIMEQAQVKRRNLFLSLNELEKAGFIERGAVYNTPTKRGMEIRFYPVPHLRRSPAIRTFHYFDKED